MKIFECIKWILYDIKNPLPHCPSGFRIYVGDQNSGKTVSMQEYQTNCQEDYSDVKIHIFANYKSEYAELPIIKSVEDLLNTPTNSIIFLDEANKLFNSRDWQKFSPAMLAMITQNRHLRKQIVMSCQNFNDVDKQIRDYVLDVIEVSNLKNRWIFQKFYKRDDYKSVIKLQENLSIVLSPEMLEKFKQWKGEKFYKRYSFIATNDLYNSYDDHVLIQNLLS